MRVKLFPNFTRHHLIAFIISIETEASLLALAKSIYYCKKTKQKKKQSTEGVKMWYEHHSVVHSPPLLSSCHICAQGEI